MLQRAVAAKPLHATDPVIRALVAVLLALYALAATGDVARGSANADLALPHASSAANGDWTYTIKPKDTPASIADRLLADRHGPTQLMGYNGMTREARLEPGETLQVPLRWLERRPRPAEATAVQGEAWRMRHPERSRGRLKRGDQLNVGEGVRTGSNGYVRIRLADGSKLSVEPRTELIFNRLTQYGRGAMADTRMNLERGRIETQVESREQEGARYEIHTPSAVAAVRGTRFGLESGSDGTLLEVREGEVWFGTSRDGEPVREGYSAFLESGSGSAPVIRPLPPSPRITSGPESTEQLPATVAWQAPEGVRRFRMDLYRADSGKRVRSETTSERRYELSDLENGDYRLRLASLGDHRLGGADTLEFSVGLQARPALLREPGRDARPDREQPRFRWSLQGDEEEARVQVARSPEFSDIVATSPWKRNESARLSEPLEPGRYCWRVVTRAGGDSRARSPVNCFEIAGKLTTTRIINTNTIDDRVDLYWKSVENAERYRLQIAEDENFESIVQDREVNDTEIRMRLDPGERYHVRVKGLAPEPMSSRWGEVREIAVE